MASGPGILRYLTVSDNYTAFIKQLINIVIKSVIDKYEEESCNLIYILPKFGKFEHKENSLSCIRQNSHFCPDCYKAIPI